MGCDFHISIRRYGPTLHLTPAGELDFEAEPAFDPIREALADYTTVVACDMRHVTFMDVTGLNCLLALGHHAETRGTILFVYNWRRQPLRLLELVDDLDRKESGLPAYSCSAVCSVLRRALGERAETDRALGVGTVREGQAVSHRGHAASRSRRPGRFPTIRATLIPPHPSETSSSLTAPGAALLPAARRPRWPAP
ncbi:STAS domain-containing protein [Streptomyces sp. NPDC003042]